MFDIWANLSLLLGLIILGAIVWLILFVICKIFFEDIIGGSVKKIKKKVKKEDDHYIY